MSITVAPVAIDPIHYWGSSIIRTSRVILSPLQAPILSPSSFSSAGTSHFPSGYPWRNEFLSLESNIHGNYTRLWARLWRETLRRVRALDHEAEEHYVSGHRLHGRTVQFGADYMELIPASQRRGATLHKTALTSCTSRMLWATQDICCSDPLAMNFIALTVSSINSRIYQNNSQDLQMWKTHSHCLFMVRGGGIKNNNRWCPRGSWCWNTHVLGSHYPPGTSMYFNKLTRDLFA